MSGFFPFTTSGTNQRPPLLKQSERQKMAPCGVLSLLDMHLKLLWTLRAAGNLRWCAQS